MSNDVLTSFCTYFDPLFKGAYQKLMAKTRDKVRVQTGFQGSTTKFQKVGKGTALAKTRHGKLPIMNVDHDVVTATMATKYAPEMIDAEDLKMTNVDLAAAYNEAISGALAKAYDDMIYTAMDATSNTVAEGSAGLTRAKVFAAFEQLNKYNVPGSDRFCAVGAHQWNELLDISEFASADFVGPNYPWLQAANARNWLGIYWYMDADLPLSSGTRKCFMWHKQAVGLGELTPFTRTMERLPDADAWLLTGKFTAGAILIEAEGCVEIACDDDAAIS
jgi:hypothetical protein